MIDFIKNIFRRKFIRRAASRIETGLMPLQAIKSVIIVLDTEDPAYNECKDKVVAFFRQKEIKVSVWFLSLASKDADERQTTSLESTILSKDLNWWGRPAVSKIAAFSEEAADMLISLGDNAEFTIDCLARCSQARFKIGRKQLRNRVFDLIFENSPSKSCTCTEAFDGITAYLNTIR